MYVCVTQRDNWWRRHFIAVYIDRWRSCSRCARQDRTAGESVADTSDRWASRCSSIFDDGLYSEWRTLATFKAGIWSTETYHIFINTTELPKLLDDEPGIHWDGPPNVFGRAYHRGFNHVTKANLAWPSLCRYRRNEYWWWLRPPLGKKQQVLRSSRPCYI